MVLRKCLRSLFGTGPESAALRYEVSAQPRHASLRSAKPLPDNPQGYRLGRDRVQDYIEAKTRYARSVLDRVEGGQL